MDWKTKYANKVMSADEAVKLIQSGDTVVFAHAVAEPVALVDAMVANKHLYKDITVSHMVTLGKGEYAKPENSDVFRYEGWFTSPSVRNSIVEGHGDFVPVFFHEIPSLIRRDMLHVDVIMVTVTPPDEHGYCNVGVSSDYTMQSIKSARVVLAEINDQVPTVFGNAYVHVDEIDAMVEFNRPLPESKPAVIGPVEEAIGKNCASLINDGDTLQLGIGAIPDAVLAQLGEKKNLGIHSEMIADGVVDLFEKGAIDCSQKGIDEGKIVVT